jgi:uncharacterized damage-inducible protein DinB
MHVQPAIQQLEGAVKRFKITIDCFAEEDATFAPKEGMFSVAYQIAHVAQTIPWCIEGAFDPKGFDMDFEGHLKRAAAQAGSLAVAKQFLDKVLEDSVKVISSKTDQQMLAKLPPGPVMGGAPVLAVFEGITDHTAHHRGSLAVYARLLGKVPKMPY